MENKSNDPLHGKTLEKILTELVVYFGWEELGQHITINCFNSNPSIQSSLKFLRKTPWARKKVEDLYIRMIEP
ncbi:MAG: VF530 family protein [Chitinophagaceae bacterium]|nr:VF530 family protein [Chitinophagaceae bacterium]